MKQKKNGASGTAWEVFLTALKLGLTSFGGPIAHIGYFRDEYVARRQWLGEGRFADLVALCQFLPGPASSQLGMAIGLGRAGVPGALAAWAGFTLPSALLMALFALVIGTVDLGDAGWLQGLKLVAVAIVAQAVWSMAKSLSPDRVRATMTLLAACWALLMPGIAGQLLPLLLCALGGWLLLKPEQAVSSTATSSEVGSEQSRSPIGRKAAVVFLAVFVLLLVALPILAKGIPQGSEPALSLSDSAYRAGSLVFGGGHVVLPMLEAEVVHEGAAGLGAEQFMAGYGAAQAVPGPLFTFAAYIGAAVGKDAAEGLLLAFIAVVAIFLPAFLLLMGALPFWEKLRANYKARSLLMGVNAGVVGILLAALYDPVFTSTVYSIKDVVFALVLFLLLHIWRMPPWLAVLAGALGGFILL